ncbi:MAG: hypothetical protein IT370_15200 [Deltaproteobacteria bacterium]|nr:hypothetical protein [Deltaproteobacteria bacterium]
MKLRVAIALVLSGLLSACGGSSKPAAKSAPVVEKPAATPTPSPTAPAQPSDHTCCCPLASAGEVEFNWTTPEACAEVGNECSEAASCAD